MPPITQQACAYAICRSLSTSCSVSPRRNSLSPAGHDEREKCSSLVPGLCHWGTDDYTRAKRSLMDSALREGRLGVAPDALHHGHQAIGALWGEMLLEMQQPECMRRVDADDVLSRLAGVEREENRDHAAHDMGVAVADEAQSRAAAIRIDFGREPDLAHAALHLVRCRALALGQGLKPAPELDHVAIAVLPVVEEREVGADLVESRDLARIGKRIHDSNIGRNGRGCDRH